MNAGSDDRWRHLLHRLGLRREWYLILLGAVVGVLTGAGAVGFAELLHATEHFSAIQRAQWPLWLVPALPMAGALLTGIVVHFLAPDARGHGVPQVMEAIAKKHGKIKLRVGVGKVAASVCTVGSGGSGGAEGPIIQIGATIGSVFARKIGVPREHISTLVGCGAAAGIASIFNAPIAGVFFVLEILLRDFSARTFMPIVIASALSAATTQALLGTNEAIFAAGLHEEGYIFTFAELPSYIILGLVCGAVAVAFGKVLHAGEDLFRHVRLHPVIKPVSGALLLGILGVATLALMGGAVEAGGSDAGRTPAFFGNGYETIRSLILPASYVEPAVDSADTTAFTDAGTGIGRWAAAGSLAILLLVLFKVVGTTFTLASGGSGGVFAPSLFMGAAAGGALGTLLQSFNLLPQGSSPASYALVGMAAVVAGAMHAPLTAILMLYELTRDEYVLLPIMLAAVVSTVLAKLLDADSIYTASLRRSGVLIGGVRDMMLMRSIPVTSCELAPLPAEPVYPSDPLSKLVTLHAYHHVPDFVVVDPSGKYVGLVTGADMRAALIDREAIPLLLVAELVRSDLPVILPDETLDSVMEKFARADVASLPLMHADDHTRAAALVTRRCVMARYNEALVRG